MAPDLFMSLLALGARFSLLLGGMLFIVSLGRDPWNAFSTSE